MNWTLLALGAALVCFVGSQGIRAPGPGEEDYEPPRNCDLEKCKLIKVKCDSRYFEPCRNGNYSSNGVGPYCCCPVCYRPKGARCSEFRICDPKYICRHGVCSNRRIF